MWLQVLKPLTTQSFLSILYTENNAQITFTALFFPIPLE